MRGFLLKSLWLSILSFRSVSAEESSSQLTRRAEGDLCYMNGQRWALVDDKLYFMSGRYHFDGDAAESTNRSSKLWWLDLKGNSTLEVDGIMSASSLNSVEIPVDTTPTLENQTKSDGGALFYSLDTFYVFSGLGWFGTADDVLAAYNTTSSSWSSQTVSGGSFNALDRVLPGSASIPSTGMSFFSGGNVDGVFAPGQSSGLLRFDASDPTSLTWRNETRSSSGSVEPPARVGGSMVYVPMGEQGVLVVFGGYDDLEKNATTGGPAFTYRTMNYQQILVYDIASATWYGVNATGDVPSTRTEVCSVMSAAPDYSSFNIAMYGGWSLYQGEAHSDTYVLSIPSFRWIQITSSNYTGSNSEALTGTNRGRHQHKCAVYNDAQMIVLGGIINNNGTEDAASCDAQSPPIRVLNLADMTWQTQFDPSATYTVPVDVHAVIGGDGSGKAQLTTPEGGFNDTAVASIFATTVARVASTASSTASITGSSPSGASKPSSHTGAIAGGVVGGVAGLALLAGLVLLLLRKRKSAHQVVPQQDYADEYGNQNPAQGGAMQYLNEKDGHGVGGPVNPMPQGQQAHGSYPDMYEMDAEASIQEAEAPMHSGAVMADSTAVGELPGDAPKDTSRR